MNEETITKKIDEAAMNELIRNIERFAQENLLNIETLNNFITSLIGSKRKLAFAGKELLIYGLRQIEYDATCDLRLSESDVSNLNFLFNLLNEIEPANN